MMEPDLATREVHGCPNEAGATAVEYAFMLAVIALAAIGAISALGTKNSAIWAAVDMALQQAM